METQLDKKSHHAAMQVLEMVGSTMKKLSESPVVQQHVRPEEKTPTEVEPNRPAVVGLQICIILTEKPHHENITNQDRP